MILLVLLGIVFIASLFAILLYNGLIRKKNDVDNAFGGIDVQLKKRYDLIPNLVTTVEQYATHEKELLEKVTQMRTQAISGNLTPDQKVAIDNQISGTLRSIMVAVENYPNLKANESFLNLQHNLNEMESQISAARRAYNAAITDFNNGIETFPGNIMAGMMGLNRKQVFEIPEPQRENVNVKNLFNA